MKLALTIQYNGKEFHGFQRQKEKRSVQGELEKALATFFRTPVTIHAAGRTDTGVHAAGQVVHFEIDKEIFYHRKREIGTVVYNINCMLPDDLSIVYAKEVSDQFHARFSCLSREYLYTVVNSNYRFAFSGENCYWVRDPLDTRLMEEGTRYLIGEHDFAAFTKVLYKRNNEKTIRRIDKISVYSRSPYLFFYYDGSGFLHNMIRIITGTLLQVGRKEIPPEKIGEILISQNRLESGMTLPPQALTFINARYQEYETPSELIPVYNQLPIL